MKNPKTDGALPGCARLRGSNITVTSSNCTINGFDFGDNVATLTIAPNLQNVIISNNYFDDNNLSYAVKIDAGSCGITFDYNTFNGGAYIGTPEGTTSVASLQSSCDNGYIIYRYNYCHNSYYKCINYGGRPRYSQNMTATERFNVFRNVSLGNDNYGHGEAEYQYSGTIKQILAITSEFNLYWDEWNVANAPMGVESQTASLAAAEADGVALSSPTIDHNLILGPGPWAVTGSDNSKHSVLTGSAAIYGGHQEGETVTSGVMTNNYIDYSGKLLPYNPVIWHALKRLPEPLWFQHRDRELVHHFFVQLRR